jgi:hypothetical protein
MRVQTSLRAFNPTASIILRTLRFFPSVKTITSHLYLPRSSSKRADWGLTQSPLPKLRRPLPGTRQDWELLFNENGPGYHRTDAARIPASGKRNDNMNEKNDGIAHFSIVAGTAKARNCCANRHKLVIRHRQAWIACPCSPRAGRRLRSRSSHGVALICSPPARGTLAEARALPAMQHSAREERLFALIPSPLQATEEVLPCSLEFPEGSRGFHLYNFSAGGIKFTLSALE